MAAPVRQTVERDYQHLTEDDTRLRAAEEENILFGLENLHTYPGVRRRLEAGDLSLHGWFFKIATGELFGFEPGSRQFQPLYQSEPEEPR